MKMATAVRALRDSRRLEIDYAGAVRVVEVHVVGEGRDGRRLMLVWQVRGGSRSGAPAGWKLLHLDEVRHGRLVDEASLAPRDGYAPHAAIARVTAAL